MAALNLPPALPRWPIDIRPAGRLQERPQAVRPRANITNACSTCKKRKRKCLGGSPCPHCASAGVECCYDADLDKRRKAFTERTRADVDFKTKLLEQLIQTIRSEQGQTIVDFIKSTSSLEEIAAKLADLAATRDHDHDNDHEREQHQTAKLEQDLNDDLSISSLISAPPRSLAASTSSSTSPTPSPYLARQTMYQRPVTGSSSSSSTTESRWKPQPSRSHYRVLDIQNLITEPSR